MSDPDVLRAAITATGLSARGFAFAIGTDERTVRRWLAGDRPMSGPVLALCRILTAHPSWLRLLR